ncbi:MAG: hypothetical protein KF905_01930 [Flavobacteriales bacterium]|nr:hypothetical protein [Flavobacteriales bacterium]
MEHMRNVLLTMVSCLFLFSHAERAWAQGDFNVTVVSPTITCYDEGVSSYWLTVYNPIYPIMIQWDALPPNIANNDEEYQMYRSHNLFGGNWMNGASASVTNGDGLVKWDDAQPYVIGYPGEMEFYAQHYPYSPGGQIHGTVYMTETYDIWFDGPGYTWLSGPCPSGTPSTCSGNWRIDNVSPGTVLNASGFNGCGGNVNMTLAIGNPTVLPAIQLVDVEGSCSNAPTGRVTVAAGATVPGPWPASGGELRRRNASGGNWLTTGVWLSPGGMGTIEQVPTGSWWVRIQSGAHVIGDSVLVEVPSAGGTCGRARGRAWLDANENCLFNGGETSLRNAVIEVLPGPVYTNTGGGYTSPLVLATGTYTATMSHPQAQAICGADPVTFTITGVPGVENFNFPSQATVPMDLRLGMTRGSARPGFPYRVRFFTENLGPLPTGDWTLSVEFDEVLEFLSAEPMNGSSVQGNTLTWQLPSLAPYGQASFVVDFQVPPDVGLLGSTVTVSAVAETTNEDGDLSNNSASVDRVITGAYDPNDKLARTSSGNDTSWIPGEDQWVDYTIRFQNTGTDTAFNVLIIDTLPPQLDPASLDVLGASHNFVWMIKGAGILKFAFPGIMLPDSNVNEALSHGLVSFRIRMRDGFMTEPGDEVENLAGIYFDFNPPIITDPCVLSVPIPPEAVLLDVRVFLGGPYDADTGLMHDDLRVHSLLPMQEPYTALGYNFPEGGGGETVHADVLAVEGPGAIVDWVVLELRDIIDASIIYHARAALLRRDGQVVDTDGLSPVLIPATGAWFMVSVHHRNHLGVRTYYEQETHDAGTGLVTSFDFTVYPPAFIHGNAPVNEVGGVSVLWPGDVNFDGQVKYTGADNDRDAVLQAIGGANPVNVVQGTYATEDVNLDGTIKYVGADNDRDVILQTIGGSVPTAVRVEQVP